MARFSAGHLFLQRNVTISDTYRLQLSALNKALGIPEDFLDSCLLPICEEPKVLVDTEPDYYKRPQRLVPEAFAAWTQMKQAAQDDNIIIFLISAFRDIRYQHDLIAKKLAAGDTIQAILAVNAAPGFSEHHTGRAVDIGTPGCDALVEAFEETVAFHWLKANANNHGFFMSYPRGNELGIDYEPWHWCFCKSEK